MRGNSLVVLWLGFCASSAEGLGSIPDRELDPTSGTAKKK